MSVYRQEEISLARASVSWPPALPLTPQVILLPLIFSLLSPGKHQPTLLRFVICLQRVFLEKSFVPWPKVRERKRESSRITMHSLRQHLLLIPHRNGVLHYLGFCPSAGFIFRLNYLRFRGAACKLLFCTMLWWTSWYGCVRQRDVYNGTDMWSRWKKINLTQTNVGTSSQL